jgi:hypothetical protein
MLPKKAEEKHSYRFALSPQDASLTDAQVRKLLEKATTEAAEAAKEDGFAVKAKSGAEGGFLDIGEITILLTLAAKSATVAKIVAAAEVAAKKAGEGVIEAAGAFFFKNYLAPRLRKMNLLPSKFRVAGKESSSSAPKPAPRKKSRSAKRR